MGNKFFKRILATALTVSLATIPALSVAPSLTVHAVGTEGNGQGSDGSAGIGSSTGTASGGVGVAKTGVIFYCVDSQTGEPFERDSKTTGDHGDAFCLVYSDPGSYNTTIKTKIGNIELADDGESMVGNTYFGTILGDSQYNMPKLYSYKNDKFTANYSEWHDWFENRPVVFEGKPYENMATLIVAHAFPDAWAKVVQAGNGEIESANISLIAEPVAWHSLFKNSSGSSSDGSTRFLTPSGWADVKISECGNKYTFTDKFDRGAFAWSMTLEHCQFGWIEGSAATIKSGLVENEDIIHKWYGLNIFNIDHMIAGHSIVTPTPAPADVESETPTNYSVIKVYERENPETKEIVSEGSYITTNAYSDLTVNEEEGWKIISVETVSPQIKTIGSNDVYEVVKGDTTTKQVYDPDSLPVSVTLSPAEPTLIVRYRATGLELPPVRLTGLISKFC